MSSWEENERHLHDSILRWLFVVCGTVVVVSLVVYGERFGEKTLALVDHAPKPTPVVFYSYGSTP